MLRSPHAICIDLDGTIADTDASVAAGIEAAAVRAVYLTGVDRVAWDEANRTAFAEVWSSSASDWIAGVISPDELSTRVYIRTLDLVHAPAAFAEELVLANGRAAEAGLRCYPDAREFLEAARVTGVKIALITNGAAATQRGTIAALGIEDEFAAIVISAEVGFAKPDVRIFEAATSALGTPPQHAWHIGDSVQSDVVGAVSSGLQAVWLDREHGATPADLPDSVTTVQSLGDLVPFLAGD